MSYSERVGSLFDADDLDVIAHGVNCRGVMGAGIAEQFAERWPDMLPTYRAFCNSGDLYPGGIYLHVLDPDPNSELKVIVNLATQDKPGSNAKLRWVAQSVAFMLGSIEPNRKLRRVGMPRIGCSIGGLEWGKVKTILELLGDESLVELVVFSL